MSELLPCPFCGGTDLNTTHPNAIYCKNIACGGNIEQGPTADLKQLKKDVIEAWNTRTNHLEAGR